ncbi:riboflavin biosynthesis protein PYRD, chloroplastic [Magnolia sinica]|uniref:riboflavin biosynthesis protein PYRD, chloroplastic n=1 Tax=Magnolia sinica TaxID=86752 RepID=UPI002657EE8E|nr:riboflavin biosynthesis protein PYRD, chloroplastic [Magnolia sinica]
MHLLVLSPSNLSPNLTLFPSSAHLDRSFNSHSCSTKRPSNSNSGNGFCNSQKILSGYTSCLKDHTTVDGFYVRGMLGLARECNAGRASNSNSGIGFCNSLKMVYESPSVLRIHNNFNGSYMRSVELTNDCYSTRSSDSHSGIGFCNSHKMGSESPLLLKNHCIFNGSYMRRSTELAKNRYGKGVSNSNSGGRFPQKIVFESSSFLKDYSNLNGFSMRCCFKRASCCNSGTGFCSSHNGEFEYPSVLKHDSNLNAFCVRRCVGLAKDTSVSDFRNWPFSSNKRVSKTHSSRRNLGHLSGIRCEGVGERDDSFYMRRCVEVARKAVGCTSPNPMVGCVIVKNGEIVGEGFHPKAGQPHAEVFALKNAGVLAENATAYVSLEPCNHYGRTPPCSEALIRAKVKHVVIGMVDPNPIVASKGVERLRESGIEVTVGVEEELCQKLNEAYIHRMLTGKPFVTLRYSLSFNGRIMNHLSKGAEESGGYYSQLLQEYDGVIISSTSLAENSTFPASQEAGANQPLRIIISAASNSPLRLPTLTTEASSPTIVFADKSTVVDPTTGHNLGRLGIETVVLERMDLSAILDYCGHRGLCSVLLDLRGDFSEILEMGFEGGLFQKVVMEVCPVWDEIVESSSALALKSVGRKSMGLKDLQSRISKGSVVVEGYI